MAKHDPKEIPALAEFITIPLLAINVPRTPAIYWQFTRPAEGGSVPRYLWRFTTFRRRRNVRAAGNARCPVNRCDRRRFNVAYRGSLRRFNGVNYLLCGYMQPYIVAKVIVIVTGSRFNRYIEVI